MWTVRFDTAGNTLGRAREETQARRACTVSERRGQRGLQRDGNPRWRKAGFSRVSDGGWFCTGIEAGIH